MPLTHPELFKITSCRMVVVDRRLVPVERPQAGSVVDLVVAADGPSVVEAFVAAVECPGQHVAERGRRGGRGGTAPWRAFAVA